MWAVCVRVLCAVYDVCLHAAVRPQRENERACRAGPRCKRARACWAGRAKPLLSSLLWLVLVMILLITNQLVPEFSTNQLVTSVLSWRKNRHY